MVRAAASGAIDYSQADPDDPNWYVRHRLLLSEVKRQDRKSMLEVAQRHWLAYVSHGRLTEESFSNTKKHASELVDEYYSLLFPWTNVDKETANTSKEQEAATATIDNETQALINAYRQRYQAEDKQ